MMMRVSIIGGGLMGMTLAYHLVKAGVDVTVLEQGAELGGMSGELAFDQGLRVPRSQQTFVPSDSGLQALCAELGIDNELVFQSARAGFLHQEEIHPLSNIIDFLRFPILGLRDRIRLGNLIWRARSPMDWEILDAVTAKDWLLDTVGGEVFERLWKPLLEAKFDWVYDHVSAAFVWAWLNRMSSIRTAPHMAGSIGYLKRGHYALIEALAGAIRSHGGKIETGVRVREIELTQDGVGSIRTSKQAETFDRVIAAIATPNFMHLIPSASSVYLQQLGQSKYLGLICPVMVLEKPLTDYWTLHLTDPNYPFATIIETPHPTQSDLSLVYLPRYTAPDNDWMGVSDEDIRKAWISHLKPLFPEFDEQQVRWFAVTRSRYVEPIYAIHAARHTPKFATPYTNLYLANSSQVFPELPTSEAVINHARRLAQEILRQPMNSVSVQAVP
jgi:protoporphyrinogen oxidase